MPVFIAGGGKAPGGVNYINYIQSSGAQYINTGFNPNQDTRVVMQMTVLSESQTNCALFGARNADQSTVSAFALWKIGSGMRTDYNTGSLTLSINPVASLSIDKNKNATDVNGTQNTIAYNSFQASYPLLLFAINGPAGPDARMVAGQLEFAQVYDNGILIRDYWPAIDPSGVVCLYDKVNKEYAYNAGAGEFIGG